MSHDLAFQCARCRVELSSSDSCLHCPSCGTSTPVRHNIPKFAANEDYFFGEIPRDAMRKLATSVDRLGWDLAFAEMCDQQPADLRNYILQYIADSSRANWKYLLHLPRDGVVLDFGCGWGETTLSLARSVRRVVSMDLTWERLLLLQSRTRDLGLHHVQFAHGGDTLPLPFADETFDAVVLNGVLEWVPVTGKGDPRQCQLAMLREFRRILKASGQVYIGIENRVGLKYFLGDIDEHSQMKYTSLLPRWLANRWCRVRADREYRTYTYSRSGYVRLLKEAGFERIDFYCPYPDYREFDRIVPLTTAQIQRLFSPVSRWKKMVLQAPGGRALLKWAVPSFSIVAGEQQTGASYLHRIVTEVSRRIGINLATPANYHSKPAGEVLVFCGSAGQAEPSVLVRIAETPVAIKSRIGSARHLESVWASCPCHGPWMDVVPRSHGHGFIHEMAFTAEEVKPGISWRKIDRYRTAPGDAVLTVAGWLTDFQQATKPGAMWEANAMHAHLDALVQRVQGLLAQRPEPPLNEALNVKGILDEEDLAPIAAVVCHGDLHLDNALFSPTESRLTGIVDWDLGDMRGLPLTDLISLLLAYGMEVKQQTYCATVRSLLEPQSLSIAERTAWFGYQATFGLDERYQRYAVQVAVLQNISALADRRPGAFKRLAESNTLPAWLYRLSSRSRHLTAY